MIRPKLKEKYHVEHVPPEGYFLLTEDQSFVLEGNSLPYVLPLLDGRLSVEEITEKLHGLLPPQEVIQAIDTLAGAGHLAEAGPCMPDALAAFLSEFGGDRRENFRLLRSCTVDVIAVGSVIPIRLINALASLGLKTGRDGAVVQIVLTDDYLHPELAHINSASLTQGMPTLFVKPVGIKLWIGPLVIPGKTACWRCLENRLRGNREIETYIERKTGKPGPLPTARGRLELAEEQAYSIVALQIIRWLITGSNSSLESRLLVNDVIGLDSRYHEIVKRPQCPDCGTSDCEQAAGRSANPHSIAPPVHTQNGLRSEAPEQTFRRYEHHISPYTGVVKEVVPSIWHGVGPLRCYVAGHNFAMQTDHLHFLKDGLRTMSSGKGRTDAQAKTSALCEALERYSGVFRGDEPRFLKSMEEIGEAAIDPRDVMLFSETQYLEREQWLARQSRFQKVPIEFEPQRRLEWTPVRSLTSNRTRYLPSSYLYYSYPILPHESVCWADSNGAAAGSALDDAMLQGLFELIERDAVALWWYNRIRRRAVNLDAFDDGYISEVKTFYRAHNREFWVLDVTSDLQVPTFVALSRRVNGPTEDIMMGFGAHLDAKIALSRAITELNQFIPTLLNVGSDGQTQYTVSDPETLKWLTTARIDQETYLLPEPEAPTALPSSFASVDGIGATEMLWSVIAMLERKNFEVLVLDQTRLDIGLPVAKMIVPGLRHFWARFAPGRLYDVPVEMGWLNQPVAEGALNPTAMFL